MIYVVIGFALVALGVVAAFGYMANKANGGQLAIRDLLDAERQQHGVTRGELETETAAHHVTRDELKKEKDLRAVAESQRNQAVQDARNQFVEHIKTANTNDAARLVVELLALPLPGVRTEVPATDTAEDNPDGLINPFTV